MQKFRDINIVAADNGMCVDIDRGIVDPNGQTLLFTDREAFLRFMGETYDSVVPPPAAPESNVIDGGFYGTAPVPAKKVLQYALDADPDDVIVIAATEDGGFSLRVSSTNLPLNVFWLELAKKFIMDDQAGEENT
jgi:hypothetical protein